MIEFIAGELSTASNLLSLALGRYLTACEAIQNSIRIQFMRVLSDNVMIELIQEIDTASSLLHDAIQRYVTACCAINNFYGKITRLSGIPRALSDRVESELVSASSYETNIKRAKSAIYQARNYSPTIAPVHSLPTEVLASIFQIVVGSRPCNIKIRDSTGANTSLPKYPDFLSHVCSRWRHVATGIPELWIHVDIAMYHSLSQGFIARAETCVARAGDLPLDIHIRVPSSHNLSTGTALGVFLKSIATRTRSLELVTPGTYDDFNEYILELCLQNFSPSKFTRLAITDIGHHAPRFVIASDDSEDINSDSEDSEDDILRLLLPHQHFEDLLLPVTNLRLHGLYPRWESKAYHGLVELRLTSTRASDVEIIDSELHAILAQSPMLRVIEFGLEIIDPLSENTDNWRLPPVRLGDLEILSLGSLDYDKLRIFLKLLDPGPNTLQLTVRYNDNMSRPVQEDGVVRFLERSRITKLRARGLGRYPRVRFHELFKRSRFPHLQVLALEGFTSFQGRPSWNPPNRYTHNGFHLNILYLISCRLELGDIKQLVEEHSPQSLVLCATLGYRNQNYVASAAVQAELSEICPVKALPLGKPDLIENWDGLD